MGAEGGVVWHDVRLSWFHKDQRRCLCYECLVEGLVVVDQGVRCRQATRQIGCAVTSKKVVVVWRGWGVGGGLVSRMHASVASPGVPILCVMRMPPLFAHGGVLRLGGRDKSGGGCVRTVGCVLHLVNHAGTPNLLDGWTTVHSFLVDCAR